MGVKTIILAGGWGTRLGRAAQDMPKPMLTVGERPLLWHIMKLYAHFGFKDFVVAVGANGHVIKNYFCQYEPMTMDFTVDLGRRETTFHGRRDEDWRVTLADTGRDTLKGGRIKRVERYLDSDVNMLTYGDGLANVDLRKLLDYHRSHGKTLTVTATHPPARFGEIIEQDGRLALFQEKPQTSTGFINGGFMAFNRKLLEHLTESESCDFEFGPLEQLARKGEVMVYKHEGRWECVDHERDLVRLNALWKSGQAFWKLWS